MASKASSEDSEHLDLSSSDDSDTFYSLSEEESDVDSEEERQLQLYEEQQRLEKEVERASQTLVQLLMERDRLREQREVLHREILRYSKYLQTHISSESLLHSEQLMEEELRKRKWREETGISAVDEEGDEDTLSSAS